VHIDESGFEHIEVGNNAGDVIEPVVDGISAFRDELIGTFHHRDVCGVASNVLPPYWTIKKLLR